jgi:hypothetical protein
MMTDHAKCRVCGGEPYSCCDEEALLPEHWIECGGVTGEVLDVACVMGPHMTSPERAWAAWDALMRPAIPEPLRELVQIIARERAYGLPGYIRDKYDAIPPDILSACLKETDE